MKEVIKNIAGLIKIKPLVTFVIVAVFSILAIKGTIEPQSVIQIVTMVIAFYFGTQHEGKQ